jgi:hypothetical protein
MNQKLTLAWRPSLAEPRGRGLLSAINSWPADVVSMLSGFETYDALAQAGHDQEATRSNSNPHDSRRGRLRVTAWAA